MPSLTGPWPRRLVLAALVAGVVLYLAVLGPRYGLDLRVYRDSASTWWSGRNPYQPTYTIHNLPFTYPPFALPVLAPLSWVPFRWSQWILWVVSIGAGTAAVLIVRGGRAGLRNGRDWQASLGWVCAAVLVLEPMHSAIDYGQIEVVLMFVIVADLLVVPAPFRGVILGLAGAVKLTPLIFLLVLVVRGDWRSTIRAIGGIYRSVCGNVDSGSFHIAHFLDPLCERTRADRFGLLSRKPLVVCDCPQMAVPGIWVDLRMVRVVSCDGRGRGLSGMAVFTHGSPILDGHRGRNDGAPDQSDLLVPSLDLVASDSASSGQARHGNRPGEYPEHALDPGDPDSRRTVLVAEDRSICGNAPGRFPRTLDSSSRGAIRSPPAAGDGTPDAAVHAASTVVSSRVSPGASGKWHAT